MRQLWVVVLAAAALSGIETRCARAAITPTHILSNEFHAVHDGGALTDAAGTLRKDAFDVAFDGVVDRGGSGQRNGWDTWTWPGGTANDGTDFVGALYGTEVAFDTVTVELGFQYFNGGDWAQTPKVYVLQNNLDSSRTRPESDPMNWAEVPATLLTPHTFDAAKTANDGGTVRFQLDGPAAGRTGYGIAVGGADGDGANFSSFTEFSATGNYLRSPLSASNIVASTYHHPYRNGVNLTPGGGSRSLAFDVATDGIIDRGSVGQQNGFDTWEPLPGGERTDFVGLLYDEPVQLDQVIVHMGHQYFNGGNWEDAPTLFVLRNPVDTNQTRPESDITNWLPINAQRVSSGPLDVAHDLIGAQQTHPNGSPIGPGGPALVFDLQSLSADLRTGWGWAVAGIDGDDAGHFISVTELRAFGIVVRAGDYNRDGVVDTADYDAWRSQFGSVFTINGTGADGNGDGVVDAADYVVWRKNLSSVSGAGNGAITANVPEPHSLILTLLGLVTGVMTARARTRK